MPLISPGVEGDRQRSVLVHHMARVLTHAALERRSLMLSVSGDAGHGKSTVLDSIRRDLAAQEITMLSMSGSAVTSTMPYAALYDMLMQRLHWAAPGLIDELSSFRATTSPLAVCAAVSKWLVDGSAGRPVVVMVDDADLVDDDSLRVLAYVAARSPSTSVSMLHAITRPVPLLDRLSVQQFQIEDLATDHAMSVAVGAGASDTGAKALVQEFGGNPLALVHGGRAAGRRAANGDPLVAARLLADVQERLREVAPDTVRLLEGLAVTRISKVTALASLAEPCERGIDVILEEMEDSGMAEVDGNEMLWRRRWMRAAVAALCSQSRRQRWSVRAGTLAQSKGPPDRTTRRSDLTNGERRVVRVILAGASTRQAAVRLHLSEKTVESHLQSVYRKFDVHSRVQLAATAHSHGLFDDATPGDREEGVSSVR